MKLKYTYLDESIELLFPDGAAVEVGDTIQWLAFPIVLTVGHDNKAYDASGKFEHDINLDSIINYKLLAKRYGVVYAEQMQDLTDNIASTYSITHGVLDITHNDEIEGVPHWLTTHYAGRAWRKGRLRVYTQSGQQVMAS